MPLSGDLLALLACPKCRHGVQTNRSQDKVLCRNCRLAYPIEDQVPIMLLDRATDLKE